MGEWMNRLTDRMQHTGCAIYSSMYHTVCLHDLQNTRRERVKWRGAEKEGKTGAFCDQKLCSLPGIDFRGLIYATARN